VLDAARKKQLRIATAESCTGGLIAGCLTAIPGSSDVFERGFVTYSDEAKTELLGVPADLIARYGAVSHEVALAMANGALDRSRSDVAVSCTGIAGPGGRTATKDIGTVYFGAATRRVAPYDQVAADLRGGSSSMESRFGDIGRDKVRLKSVETALTLLHGML
jgi:nicotinamide-nucleotide amidase